MKVPGVSPPSPEPLQQDTMQQEKEYLGGIIKDLLNRFPEELRGRWEDEVEDKDDKVAIQILESALSAREKVLEGSDGNVSGDPSLREEIQKVIEDLERVEQQGLDVIGKGNYGRVLLSPHSYRVCTKYLIDKVQMESHQKAIISEHGFLKNLRGFSVEGVRVPNVFFKGLKKPPYSLGMERIYGRSLEAIKAAPEDSQDLIELIKSQSRDEVIFKITHFLKQMHLIKRVIHGDIHAGNIMIDKRGNWFVIDFGMSKNIEFDDGSAELKEKDILKAIETINDIYDSI